MFCILSSCFDWVSSWSFNILFSLWKLVCFVTCSGLIFSLLIFEEQMSMLVQWCLCEEGSFGEYSSWLKYLISTAGWNVLHQASTLLWQIGDLASIMMHLLAYKFLIFISVKTHVNMIVGSIWVTLIPLVGVSRSYWVTGLPLFIVLI